MGINQKQKKQNHHCFRWAECPLFAYCSEERGIPNEELVLRFQRRSEAGEDTKDILEELYIANLKFICTILLPYQKICGDTGASVSEDLLQHSYFSLAKAAGGYRFDTGSSFTTFLGRILKRDATRYLRTNKSLVHVPEYLVSRFYTVTKTREKLTAELGRPPTRAELLQATGLTDKQMKATESAIAASRTVSLDSPVSGKDGDTGQTVGDFVPDQKNGIDEAINAQNKKGMEEVWHIMGQKLTERQMLIMQMHDVDGLPYSWIARDLNLSGERIRKIREEAIDKLMTGRTRDKLAQLDEEISARAYSRPGIGLDNGQSGNPETLIVEKITREGRQERKLARNALTTAEARREVLRKCTKDMKQFLLESEQAGIVVDYIRILRNLDK